MAGCDEDHESIEDDSRAMVRSQLAWFLRMRGGG